MIIMSIPALLLLLALMVLIFLLI